MVQHKAHNLAAQPRTEDIQINEEKYFYSMSIPQPILKGLKKCGYKKPSPIQKEALPFIKCGMDLIIQAKAGTGKTCVFTIAALELVRTQLPHLQAVVLTPTREIAQQVTSVISSIGSAIEGLKTCCFVGGYPVQQDKDLASCCHIAVGTPGRIKHLINLGHLITKYVRLFVLDEADKLLEETFIEDINEIFYHLPESKQVLACSATYTSELVSFVQRYMNRGQYVTPRQTSSGSTTVLLGIHQYASVLTYHLDKLARLRLKEKHLLDILSQVTFNQCLVFSNFHTRATSVCNLLRANDWSAEWIAGKQEQADRVIAMDQLKQQRVRVLVTTDLTARGIDVENVNLVINLDVPQDYQTYLHRMGRAGRYGSHGMVISIIFEEEELHRFQKLLGEIGGISQCVNMVPKNLKHVDLWNNSEKELEQICGIVNSPDVTEEESSRTESDEQFSQESSNESEVEPAETQIHNREIVPNNEFCSCKLYIASLSDVEVISSPSLFSITKKEEHWREVLPVVVHESKLPLNIPLALLGSKLIRVKNRNKHVENVNDNVDTPKKELIKFATHCEDTEFLSLNEIKSSLDNGVILSIDSEIKVNGDCNVLDKEETCSSINNFESYEEGSVNYTDFEQVLNRYENSRGKMESYFGCFDSFDVVGWMAVDETYNVLDDLMSNDYDVFEFDLITCSSGKSHIKVSSSSNDSVKENIDCENHISTLNLEELNLIQPLSLADIAGKLTITDNTTVVKTKIKSVEKKTYGKAEKLVERGNKSIAGMKYAEQSFTNGFKKRSQENSTNGYNSKDTKDTSKKGTKNKNSKVFSKQNVIPQKKCSNDNAIRVPHNKNNSEKSQSKSSDNKQKESNTSNKVMVENKGKPENCKLTAVANECLESLSLASSPDNTKVNTLKKLKKQKKSPSESSSSSGSSCCCSSSKSSDLSEYSSKVGYVDGLYHCSCSEESGPYVDMSQNLAKWQELHNCDESDSGSSSESDVLCLKGSAHQCLKDIHSDTTICSDEELSVGAECKDFKCSFSQQRKPKEKWHDRQPREKTKHKNFYHSYESEESEATNRHSFQTALSQHYGSERFNSDNNIRLHHHDNSKSSSYSNSSTYVTRRDLHRHCKQQQLEQMNHPSGSHQAQTYYSHHRSNQFAFQNSPHQHHCYGSSYPTVSSQSNPQGKLSSNNLFTDWYSTWYTEVRNQANQIAQIEYINTMSSP